MTVSAGNTYIPYTANGATTAFPYHFEIASASHLKVIHNGVLQSSGYTVSGVGSDAGGTVTYSVAPPNGTQIVFYMDMPYDRQVDYDIAGDFLESTLDADQDYQTLQIKQLADGVRRSLRLPLGSSGDGILVNPVGNKILALNPSATGFVTVDANVGTLSNVDYKFSSVAAMSGQTGMANGALAQTFGYYTNGDGGHGTYRYDSSSSATVNGGTVINAAGGAGRWLLLYDGEVSVRKFGAKLDGSTDDGPSVRQALASGIPLLFPSGTLLTNYDPASAFDDGGTTRYGWSLKIPSNASLRFAGCKIKQANGAQKWNRVVVTTGNSNITILGELYIDANVENVGSPTNEHMHGLFIFDSQNIYIERVRSESARGDNIFIGGTNETTYSSNITIGSIYAKKAGRKNLVIHMVDGLKIGLCELDNSTGGASIYSGGVADGTDKHCLDVEPDTFTGTVKTFVQNIACLKTYGLGNDFTAGTTPTHADNWILNIGSADCVQSGGSATVSAWVQNAITINVGVLKISNIAGHAEPILLQYAARLNCNEFTVSGATLASTDYIVRMAASGGDANTPKAAINRMGVKNTNGNGVNLKSANVAIQYFLGETSGICLSVGDSVSSASYRGACTINHFESLDSGTATTGYVVFLDTYAITGYSLTINKAVQKDTRGSKAGYFAYILSGNSSGFTLRELISPESIVAINWAGTDKYYRLSGGQWTSTPRVPAYFVCNGTPESMIPAPVGSLALRDDGGASTTLYVKQSGTSNTGWVAK